MPRSCSEHDLKLALNHLRILPMTTKEYLNHSIVPVDDDKFVCDVTCRPVNFEPDYLFWIVTVILGTITFICVVATIADYYQEVENEKMEMSLGEKTIKEGGVSEEGLFKYFLAFSMLSNGRSLMRISKNLNNLKGVECIR